MINRQSITVAFCALLPALCVGSADLRAQSPLEDALRQLSGPNARGYLQPLADLFAADMSAGWYRSAGIWPLPLSVSVELVGMATVVREKHRAYTATAPSGFTPTAFETATVLGGVGTQVTGPNGTAYRGSDGVLGGDLLPAAVPQLRVSSTGTEVLLRYFSSGIFAALPKEFPETRLLGIAARHDVGRYLPGLPVDLAAGIFYSNLRIGSGDAGGVSATYSGLAAGLQASKTLALLTVYLGAATDGGNMSLRFESTSPDQPGSVDVDLPVRRKMRFTAGVALGLGLIKLAADVNVGSETTFSGGIRVGM